MLNRFEKGRGVSDLAGDELPGDLLNERRPGPTRTGSVVRPDRISPAWGRPAAGRRSGWTAEDIF